MTTLGNNRNNWRDGKWSKTEIGLFSSRKTLNTWLLKYENLKISSTVDNAIVNINKENIHWKDY